MIYDTHNATRNFDTDLTPSKKYKLVEGDRISLFSLACPGRGKEKGDYVFSGMGIIFSDGEDALWGRDGDVMRGCGSVD